MEHWNKPRTIGERFADELAQIMGSWKFIIWQSVFFAAWIVLNMLAITFVWDPYPFILLNLFFSIQAAYAGPIIMMSQNRQAKRDREQAEADYETNIQAKREIEQLQKSLHRIETEKLDEILKRLP